MVGKNISNYCYPKSIKMTGRDKSGALILSVERGNEINIEYSKREIINKINSYFGYKLINEVRLQTFNSIAKKEKNKQNKPSKEFKEKINHIKNKDIRDSLSELLDVARKWLGLF